MKKIILALVLFLTLPLTAFAEMSLFVGEGCRSCEVVLQYNEANNLQQSIGLKIYEIYYDRNNNDLYQTAKKKVGYTGDSVPLLVVDDIKYVSGSQNIVDYFESFKTQKTEESPTLTNEDSQKLNDILSEEEAYEQPQSSLLIKLLAIIVIAVTIGILFRRKN